MYLGLAVLQRLLPDNACQRNEKTVRCQSKSLPQQMHPWRTWYQLKQHSTRHEALTWLIAVRLACLLVLMLLYQLLRLGDISQGRPEPGLH